MINDDDMPDKTVEEQKRLDEEQGLYTVKKTWNVDWDLALVNVASWLRKKLFG